MIYWEKDEYMNNYDDDFDYDFIMDDEDYYITQDKSYHEFED